MEGHLGGEVVENGVIVKREAIHIYEDIWRLLFQEYIDVCQLPAPVIQTMQSISTGTKEVLQPYLYRHIHLRRARDVHLFFATLDLRGDLGTHLTSIHLAFIPTDSKVWILLRTHMPGLGQLSFISFAYSGNESDPLGYILAKLGRFLPAALQTLHLRSSCNPEDVMASGSTPWTTKTWCGNLAQIPSPITTFILTTPDYVVWPPTTEKLNKTRDAWTFGLSSHPGTSLRRIFVNSGFVDGGEGTQVYMQTLHDNQRHMWGPPEDNSPTTPEERNVDFCLERTYNMEGSLGTRILWESMDGHSWTTHPFAGGFFDELPLHNLAAAFGHEDGKWQKAWAHGNYFSAASTVTAVHVDHHD
ncbi:hypothetical protein B0H11DRAFT_1936185 [Mycena galericulata]|nr:hypothetical protein B0H11DRAFT_1936185 [Mycena galericulata]